MFVDGCNGWLVLDCKKIGCVFFDVLVVVGFCLGDYLFLDVVIFV